MRFFIFAILAIFLIWALKSFAQASSKKIANKVRSIIVIVPIIIAAIFVFLGKEIHPFTQSGKFKNRYKVDI